MFSSGESLNNSVNQKSTLSEVPDSNGSTFRMPFLEETRQHLRNLQWEMDMLPPIPKYIYNKMVAPQSASNIPPKSSLKYKSHVHRSNIKQRQKRSVSNPEELLPKVLVCGASPNNSPMVIVCESNKDNVIIKKDFGHTNRKKITSKSESSIDPHMNIPYEKIIKPSKHVGKTKHTNVNPADNIAIRLKKLKDHSTKIELQLKQLKEENMTDDTFEMYPFVGEKFLSLGKHYIMKKVKKIEHSFSQMQNQLLITEKEHKILTQEKSIVMGILKENNLNSIFNIKRPKLKRAQNFSKCLHHSNT